MKKLVALLLAVSMVFILVSCGSKTEQPETKTEQTETKAQEPSTAPQQTNETKEDVVLRVSCIPGNPSAQMRMFGDAFQETHPGVTVEVVEFEEATYIAQGARILTAPENKLDVAWYYRSVSWDDMVDNGVYEPLNDIYEQEDMVKGYGKDVADMFSKNGNYYAIPFVGTYLSNIFYNTKIMKEHGWEVPKTWDELYDLAAKIKAAGLIPVAIPAKDSYGQHPMQILAIRMFDNESYATLCKGGQTDIKWTDDRWVALWKELARMQDNIFQEGAVAADANVARSMFFQGQAVMYSDLSGGLSRIQAEAPAGFEYSYTMWPDYQPDIPSRVPVFMGNMAVVLSGSQNKELAREFIALCGSQEGQSMIGLNKKGVPARADISSEAKNALGEVFAMIYQDMEEKGTAPMMSLLLDSEFSAMLDQVTQGVLSKSMSPEQACKLLQETYDSVYSE